MRVSRLLGIAALGIVGWTAGAAVSAVPAAACMINPGQQCAADHLAVSSTATMVATTSGTKTANQSGEKLQWSWLEDIYSDPSNVYCPGCLTWIVRIKNNSTSTTAIATVTVSGFTGFKTDIGYIVPPGTAPGLTNPTTRTAPNNPSSPGDVVERSADGSVLRWRFVAPEIVAGKTTVLLEVETNASHYNKNGTITVEDGVNSHTAGFEPVLPEVPFVPALGLLGGVIGGRFVLRRRGQRR